MVSPYNRSEIHSHGGLTKLILRNFTSQWFLIPQGTAVTGVILHQLDYQFHGLKIISYIFWIVALCTLCLFVVMYCARVIVFPRDTAKALRTDQAEVSGLSSANIAFTSVIQMASLTLVSGWGGPWGEIVYILWWITFAIAVLIGMILPFLFLDAYPSGISGVTPSTSLPLISVLTAAAGGGTICNSASLSSDQQIPIIILSYLLIGFGLPLSFFIDVLFSASLLDKHFLPKAKSYQLMILCGPWGQSSFAFLGLGGAILKGAFSANQSAQFLNSDAEVVIGYVSIFAGILVWGFGTFWWVFAILSITRACFDGRRFHLLPFGLPAWAIIFPWGVYTNAAVQLGVVLNSRAFKVWSTVLATILVILWLIIAGGTVRMLFTKAKSYRRNGSGLRGD